MIVIPYSAGRCAEWFDAVECGETVWGNSPPRWPRLGNFIISRNSNESPLQTPLPTLFLAEMSVLPVSCMLRSFR